MRKFIPNLRQWSPRTAHENDLPGYAQSKAANRLAVPTSNNEHPPLTAKQLKLVEHAEKYAKEDSKDGMTIPSIFSIDACIDAFLRQLETGKPITLPPVPGI